MRKLFTLVAMCMLVFSGFAQDPGTLDETFGDGGITTFNPTSRFDFIKAIVIQEDGKIIIVGDGQTDGTNYSVFVARQNPDGSLDETWGTNGISYFKADPTVYKNEAYDAKLAPNGLLYIAGHIFDSSNGDSRGFVLCLDENGFEYPLFGENGYAISESGNGINYTGIDIDSFGRCVVSGYTQSETDTMFVRRYNVVGLTDPSFGTNGTFKIGPHEAYSTYGYDVKCVEDQKLIVGGTRLDYSTNTRATLYKVTNNGFLDTNFGTNGYVELNIGDGHEQLLDIEVDLNGDYLCTGHSWLENQPYLRYETYVARITKNGDIDTSFGTEGYARLQPLENAANNCYDISVASDGQIFGTITSELWYQNTLTSMRIYAFNLTADGQLNEDFAGTGYLPFSFDNPEMFLRRSTVQNDGKLIVGGYLYDGNVDTEMMIARINTSVASAEPEEDAGFEIITEIIDANTIKAYVTPNEFTTEYHAGIISLETFEQIGVETLVQALQADGNALTGEQEITFNDLTKLTDYVILVTGCNESGSWVNETVMVSTPDEIGYAEIENAQFNIYPNPATSTVFVETTMDNAQISIIDLTGRCVKSVEMNDNVATISVDDIDNGVYFITIQNENNRIVDKLVVK